MSESRPAIYEHMATLSDPTRGRILLLLERGELSVSELCSVLQLPQSTASRHLKALQDEEWVSSRPEGTQRRYFMNRDEYRPAERTLWELIREQTAGMESARADAARQKAVLVRRRERSREFFASKAGKWNRLRDELFGPSFHLLALLGLLEAEWVVADLGCGSGPVVEALSIFVAKAIGVDESEVMVRAARTRLEEHDNTEILQGELESLPIEDGLLDAATMILVLHHQPHPVKALAEAHRVLKPGGRLLVVDMVPHEREEYRQNMGHVRLGFSEENIGRIMRETGFRVGECRRHDLDSRQAMSGRREIRSFAYQ